MANGFEDVSLDDMLDDGDSFFDSENEVDLFSAWREKKKKQKTRQDLGVMPAPDISPTGPMSAPPIDSIPMTNSMESKMWFPMDPEAESFAGAGKMEDTSLFQAKRGYDQQDQTQPETAPADAAEDPARKLTQEELDLARKEVPGFAENSSLMRSPLFGDWLTENPTVGDLQKARERHAKRFRYGDQMQRSKRASRETRGLGTPDDMTATGESVSPWIGPDQALEMGGMTGTQVHELPGNGEVARENFMWGLEEADDAGGIDNLRRMKQAAREAEKKYDRENP